MCLLPSDPAAMSAPTIWVIAEAASRVTNTMVSMMFNHQHAKRLLSTRNIRTQSGIYSSGITEHSYQTI